VAFVIDEVEEEVAEVEGREVVEVDAGIVARVVFLFAWVEERG